MNFSCLVSVFEYAMRVVVFVYERIVFNLER
jgi:hypothetical protein